MKNGRLPLFVAILMVLSACAVLPRRSTTIAWPQEINSVEALCDLDMRWKGMKHSGSMSLRVVYPSRLHFEVYGPFGDTLLYLDHDGTNFLLAAQGEKITDPGAFEERFGIRLHEFIEDVTLRSQRQQDNGASYVQRDGYRVVYRLNDGENTMCWEGPEGTICLRFVEATFGEEGRDQGRNGSL